MAPRTLVSYTDLAPSSSASAKPRPAAPLSDGAENLSHGKSHPTKKRKKSSSAPANGKRLDWDHIPPPSHVEEEISYDEEPKEPLPLAGLSQAEIWDDSALIDAWEAANEEYKRLNGSEDSWKTEPVRTSALAGRWQSVPAANVAEVEDTLPPATTIEKPRTREEAFSKVAYAWYWAGYWTAIYHTMEAQTEDGDENDLVAT